MCAAFLPDMPSFLLPPVFEILAVNEDVKHLITPPMRPSRRAILLIAKSAFAASPHLEMQRLAEKMAEHIALSHPGDIVQFAFTEQGTPSLREGLFSLLEQKLDYITILPLVLPVEPSFRNWLVKSLKRWRASATQPWPEISITGDIASASQMLPLMSELLEQAQAQALETTPGKAVVQEGSLVPAQKYRVLVCSGGACNSAGADTIWNHLRNQQERLKLRVTGAGTMTAKSTCLGPCNLAPVLQVFPDGTYYGGVTEQAVDDIISGHLLGSPELGNHVVETHAYHPTGRKQRLRIPQN